MTTNAGIGPIVRRRALSALKGIALAVLALGGVVVLLLLAVHLPWVQARVTTWALSKLEARGIRVRTRVLTYNLATRSVHVEGLTVSTTADAQEPFVVADRIDATLPRSVFTGGLAIASLRGDNVRFVVVRHQDGSMNLPKGDDGPPGSSSFPIDALTLPDMSVVWRDDVLGVGLEAKAVSVNLAGGRGTLAFTRPATLRAGESETSVDAAAQIAWDGAKLAFESLRLQAPEATLNASGSVGFLDASRPLAVEGSGTLDLDRVTRWFALTDRPIGVVAFQVHAAGTTSQPNADLTITSQSLAWQGLAGASIDAAMHIDRNALDTGRFTVRALGGNVTGRGRLSFAPGPERARVAFDWQNIDATRLMTALGTKAQVGVAALIDGRATAVWTAWSADALTADVEAKTRASVADVAAVRSLTLDGTATLNTRAGTWRAAFEQSVDRAAQVEGHADGRLAAGSLAASTMNGAVVATADSLTELWRTLHKFDLAPGEPPASLPGGIRADLTLSGRVDNPSLGGRVEATLPALNRVEANGPANLKPSGALSLSAMVSGTARAPAIAGRLMGEALSIAGQQADHLDASFGIDAQAARVEQLVLTQAGGQLTARGHYDLRSRQVTARLTANNVTVKPVPGTRPDEILVPLDARLNGEFQLSGTVDDPQGSGALTLDDTRVLDRDLGRVSTTLTLGGRELRAAVALADLFTTGTATLAVGASSTSAFTIDTQTTDADLAMLASRLSVAIGTPVTGQASLTAHIEGVRSDVAHARTTVNLQRLEAEIGAVPVRSIEPGRASYDGRTLDVAAAAFGIGPDGRSQLRVAGRLGAEAPGTLVASLDGQASDLEQIALVFAAPDSFLADLQVEGRVRVDVRAPGTLDRPALTAEASVDEGRVALAGQPQPSTILLRASYGDGLFKLSKFDATWQAATVSATGDIPIGLAAPKAPVWLVGETRPQTAGHLRARFESVTPAVLAPFVPPETVAQLAGLVTGTITLDADRPVLAAVRGQVVLDKVELSVAGVAYNQQEPTRLDVADGRVRVASWNWGGSAGNAFSVSGSVTFDGTPALDVSMNGSVDLRALGAFMPRVATGGQATLTARVTGTPKAPLFAGTIDLKGGALRMTSPRLVLSDLTGSILLSQDEVTVRDIEAQANGGTLYVAGVLKHSGSTLTSGRVAITGRDLAMAIPQDLKTEVNLDLTLAADRGALTLSGDAVVLGGSYREPISLTGSLLQFLQTSPNEFELDQPSAINAMALDVRLTTGEDIVVNNNYAQLGLAADVRIRGTVAAPTLLGRAEAREGGRIFLGGNVYQIEDSGAIDFSNPTRIEPDLQISAKTRVGSRQITLTLTGTPARLETSLTSDDGLSEGEIVSLLVTGQTQSANAMSIGTDQVIGYLSGEVLGVTGRALGLDALRVERGQDVRFDAGLVASETDPSSRLTFGKQVTRNVEVVFSQSLKDTGALTWIIGYRPKPNIEIRLVSQDSETQIVDFRHDVTIGGDPVAKARASRPESRVASLKFTGTPGVPEDALRDRLKLTEGKKFDFFRWQEDRDRLEAWLRKDGYYEARVSTRRSGTPAVTAETVDLTYDVYRGPRTVVDLAGIPEDGKLRDELERIWGEAVFDGFLLDEARNATHASMARGGYLNAMITTSISQPEGSPEKHLVVSVQPGMRYTRLRLAFTGREHVSEGRLDEVAASVTSPWIDPAPLVQAITTMYRNEGYVAAGVSVSPPRFDGDTATLPVVIREGPQFRLASVTFVGVHAHTPAEKAFTLKPGEPMTRASVDAAVQALEKSYRTDGFNLSRIILTNQATRSSGMVALVVTVDEGPQQIVRAITVEGTRRTSPDLVSRQLKLEVGKPVDLAAWAQARKRLFDTSVFRQVDIQAVPLEPSTAPPSTPSPLEPGVKAADPADDVHATDGIQDVRARVTLAEFAPLRVRYGFEVNDELEPVSDTRTLRPGVAADATFQNLFGRAAKTGLAVRYTKDFEAVRGFFGTPSFFGLPLTSSLFLQRSREHLGTDTIRPTIADTSKFVAEQRFRAWRRLQMAYSYSFERNRTFDPNALPDEALAFDVTSDIARLVATGLVDTRDDLTDATRGLQFSSSFEWGVPSLGSDLRFWKYFVRQNYYRTLGHGVVFATSGRLGLEASYGQELISTEKFFAGGGNSVRGYRQDGLGPVDFLGPVGGNALLVFNQEIRFPIFWRFRGVGFFDAGNAFENIGDLAFRDLRAGVGGGLRVVTPFALLRVDLGTPVAPQPGENRLRWFFSIGQSF